MKARGFALAALIAATGGFLRAESPAWSNEGPPFVVSVRAERPPILRPPPASRAPRTVVRPDGPVPKS